MRRHAALIPVPFVALVLLTSPVLTSPALAAQGSHHAQTKQHPSDKHGQHRQHRAEPMKHASTLVGTISDTPTATIATSPSDSSTATTSTPSSDTSTITIAVKGGGRGQHARTVVVTLDKHTVVRRHGPATAADLRKGDHVSVKARLLPDGSWLATRVNASPRDPAKQHE